MSQKYLVKATEIVSSAKEDMDGETTLFIAKEKDILEYAKSNHNFQRSGAWVDSYIGSSTYYSWMPITNEQAKIYKAIIKAYSELLGYEYQMQNEISGVVFEDEED